MSDDYEECSKPNKPSKTNNVLPIWGNEQSMNLNPLILANIQGSSYFKVHLFKLKTYHEVVDEIYYQVRHLEPWERGSRKTAGQTGMCGGVRGVGAGGIVSTAYCLLYKLYTLRLTRKQLNGLLAHPDSPFIRSLGFMYVRYTQPPADLLDWLLPYLEDEEALEGGGPATIGQLARHLLTKLDWHTTLFPRIPVPIQKHIQERLAEHDRRLAQHSKYPRERDNAPRDRDNAPRDRDNAPRDRDNAPRDRDNGPRDRDNAPRDRDNTPRDNAARDNAPRDRDNAPRDREGNSHRDRDRERERDRDRDRGSYRNERDRDRARERDRRDRGGGRERSPASRRHHR